MLCDGHEFNMRETHTREVFHEWPCQLTIIKGFGFGFLLPRAHMHFINAHWGAQRVACPATLEPFIVRPLEPGVVPNDGCILGRDLKEEAKGISFQDNVSVNILKLKFVVSPLADARNKYLPNSRHPQQSHRVATSIPMIEVAHDADTSGVRRPHREAGSFHPVHRSQLCAKFFKNPSLITFAKQEQIRLAERG